VPTGDKAILRQEPGDRRSVRVHAAKGAGRAPTFQIVTVRGDIHVFPSDVRHLVGRLLDPELFNVSALVRMGYADAKATTLPMIVQHAGTARRPAGVTAASLRPVRELTSLRATAVRQPRPSAARLGDALARTAVSARRTTGSLAGVTRVWLDRRLHKTALDPNLTQIRVPAAWDQGLTGEGVRVAVLDTGIHATHPDLAGQVVAAANFSESDSTTDRDGHGAHVASTVAGTGPGRPASARGSRSGPTCSTARSSTTSASALNRA
jgi:subtilisin family serine protease